MNDFLLFVSFDVVIHLLQQKIKFIGQDKEENRKGQEH